MVAPVLASTSKALANSGSSVVVTKPSGTASGDYLYALVNLIDNTSNVITPPAGWTLMQDHPFVFFGFYQSRTALYRKVAGSSEPADYTWTAPSLLSLQAFLYRVTGADSDASVELVTTSGTTYPFSSITTTVADTLVLLAGFSTNATTGEWAEAVPSGTSGASSNEAGGGAATFTQAVVGATGVKSVTQAASFSITSPGIAFTVAIAPPSGPPTLATLTLSATIADNASNGTVAGTIGGRTASSTLTLTDDAGGGFAIDSATGEITKAGTLSYLSSPYSITVRETLTGATNTPNDTVLSVTVTRGYVGPKWLGVGAVASGTGNITPALPASMAVSERMVLIAESANQAIAVPAGWSEIPGSPQGTGTAAGTAATRLAVFTRVYQSGDAAPTITDPGDHSIARIHRFEASTVGETSGNVAATASTSGTMPSVTTTADDALIVLCAAVATDIATARFSAWTNAALSNLTERSDDATTQGNGGGIGLTTGEKITAGATGTTSFTAATSSVQGRLAFALYAPSAGPTRAPRSYAMFID